MVSEPQPVALDSFCDDVGMIRTTVLQAMQAIVYAGLPASDQRRLKQAIRSVGLAGVWMAMMAGGTSRELLGAALAEAVAAVEKAPETWRRHGSALCSHALGLAGHVTDIRRSVASELGRANDAR